MVGLPVLGIILMLRAGESLEAPIPVGKTWKIRAQNEQATCYGMKLPMTVPVEQSGIFLHANINNQQVQGRFEEGIASFQFNATSGPCANTELTLNATILEKSVQWPAVLSAPKCQQCKPLEVMIHRTKD